MIRSYFKIVCLSATLFVLAFTSCKDEPKKPKQAQVTFKKEGTLQLIKTANDSVVSTLDIEIADNEFENPNGTNVSGIHEGESWDVIYFSKRTTAFILHEKYAFCFGYYLFRYQ